tara:strand:- start:951 stop:1145 length:195 start_codon:yes stop_codon:yes gene_type:complete
MKTINEIVNIFEETFERKMSSAELVMINNNFNKPTDRRMSWSIMREIIEYNLTERFPHNYLDYQ